MYKASVFNNRIVKYALARIVRKIRNILISNIHVDAFYKTSMFSFVANLFQIA